MRTPKEEKMRRPEDELDEELQVAEEDARETFHVIDALLDRLDSLPKGDAEFWRYVIWSRAASALPLWLYCQMTDEIAAEYRLRLKTLIDVGETIMQALRERSDEELVELGIPRWREHMLEVLMDHHRLLFERGRLDPATRARLDEIFGGH